MFNTSANNAAGTDHGSDATFPNENETDSGSDNSMSTHDDDASLISQSSISTIPDAEDYWLTATPTNQHNPPLVQPSHNFVFSTNTKTETDLLHLLLELGAPLYGFQKIMKWAKAAHINQYNFMPQHETYQGQIANLYHALQSHAYQPYEQLVHLPSKDGSSDVSSVIVFDFVAQLFSLLSDPCVNTIENLVFHPNDPFGKYVPPDGRLGEMMSGEWYANAWDHMEASGTKDFLIPIILYIDKTVLSQSNKLSVYPVTMSLGIFTEQARRNPSFWRPLGYITNESIDFAAGEKAELSADLKSARFHKILEGILLSFIKAQQPDQLNGINMQLGPHHKLINLYVPLAFVIGDIEGGNQLTGYRGFTRLDCPRVSMTCDCTTMNASNTQVRCNRIKQGDVKALVRRNDVRALHAMCQRPTDLVFFKVDFGNDPYGCFSMVMTEPLHALEAGILPYVLEILLSEIPEKENRARLDRLIQGFGELPRQNGTRSFPRLHWPDGVTSLVHLTGDQKTGKFFAVAMLSNTEPGKSYFIDVLGSTQRWKDMNDVFETLLCYWAWLKKDTFWRQNDKAAEEAALQAIHAMVNKLMDLWPRATGNGYDIPKIHGQFHVPRNIARMGNQLNIHSGPQEANHITLSKDPAQTTQRRAGSIDHQLATRLAEHLVIQKAHHLMHLNEQSCISPNAIDATRYATKGRLVLSQQPNATLINAHIEWCNKKHKLMLLPHYDHIIALMIKNFWHLACGDNEGNKQISFPIFTEYNRNGEILYRSHNCFRGSGPWMDWAFIHWEEGDGLAKILVFLEVPVDGLSAIVYPCEIDTCTRRSKLTEVVRMERHPRSRVPHLQIVSVDSLQQHALVLPLRSFNYPNEHDVDEWLYVHDREFWADQFHLTE